MNNDNNKKIPEDEAKRQLQLMAECIEEFRQNSELIKDFKDLPVLTEAFLRMAVIFGKSICSLSTFLSATGDLWEKVKPMEILEEKPTIQ